MNVADSCPTWLNEFNEWLLTLDEQPDDEQAARAIFRAGWIAAKEEAKQ